MSEDWSHVELGDVAKVDTGYPFKSSKYTPEGTLKVVRGKNITVGKTRWGTDAKFWEHEIDALQGYLNQAGDIVVGMDGSKVGENRAMLSEEDQPSILAQRVARIRANGLSHQGYLWQVINSNKFVRYIKLIQTGTSIPHISLGQLRSFSFHLPPLPEQKAIAHILGTLDDKIELNRKMNETLEQMAQALFQSWFVDFDPVIDNALAAGNEIPEALHAKVEKRKKVRESQKLSAKNPELAALFPDSFTYSEELGKWVPEGWEVKSFGEVSVCLDSKRVPLSKQQREELKPGSYPYYGATSINDYISEYIFDDTYLLLGEDGSVVREDGTPFTQYVWGKIWVNNHAHVLQGTNGVSTEHLLTFIRQENINAYVTGAVQMKLNQKNMKGIPFLFAGKEVNTVFGNRLSPFYEKFKANFEQTNTLTNLRDTLLPQLISGKLRVPEAMINLQESLGEEPELIN